MSMNLAAIAKSAGVSPSTISRVINGKPGVSEERAKQVRSLIEQMGYEGPRTRRAATPSGGAGVKTIGYVQLGDGYLRHPELFALMLKGATRVAGDLGIRLQVMICPSGDDLSSLASQVSGLDGLLLAGTLDSEALPEAINDMPKVWLTSSRNRGSDEVLSGNEEAGRSAARYLAERGHHRLLFWNPSPSHAAFTSRFRGFQGAARELGCETIELIPERGQHMSVHESDREMIDRVLTRMAKRYCELPIRPSGLFVPTDLVTAHLYPLLRRHGIETGRDVEVVSFGNEQTYLAGLDPRPAAIDMGAELIGMRSVDQLAWRVRYPNEARQCRVSLDPLIVPGDSGRFEDETHS